MYAPSHFKNTNADEVRDFIRANSFAALTSFTGTKLVATHLPLELTDDNQCLQGHISRANPQWKYFNNEQEVMAIFTGPHAYISSSWYDHENVPTWNYIAAHVYGKVRIIEGEELYLALKKLVDRYEAGSANPISMEKMSPEYVRKSMNGLVGFEIRITNIEAAYKLSQNRDDKNFRAITTELRKRTDVDSHDVADAMEKIRPLGN